MANADPYGSRPPSTSPATLETVLVPNSNGDKLHGHNAVLIALAANLLIGMIKLFAFAIGRQTAMMSEAIHSFADGINSGFLLIGLQKGSRNADRTHPFGYGLETTLWAMLASVMMLLMAFWSVWTGVQRIMQPEVLSNYLVAALVLVASVVLELSAVNVASKAVLNEKGIEEDRFFKRIMEANKHVRSVVSPTTRFVFYEDSIALIGTVIAFVAITVSQFGSDYNIIPKAYAHIPDACASILIGFMLLGLAVYLFLHNSKGLTGSSAGPQVEERIRQYVLSLSSVSQIHDLRTIDYGMSGVVVHMRVEVAPDTPVKDVDDLTERIRDRVQARVGNVKEVIIEVLADETNEEWHGQLDRLVKDGIDRNVLKVRESLILKNVYEFTKVVVADIMVPRTDVDCLEASASMDDLIDMVVTTGHTRIPIYDEDVDNMLGAVHVKDVFNYFRQGKHDIALSHLVREWDIYPENKPVSDMLEEFKRKKTQIAMVADEHGGFAGVVTLEDVLEQIVGDIQDEYDVDDQMLELAEPNRLLMSGRLDIDILNERYNLNVPDEEFNTVGGFVFGLLGREPKEADTIGFEDMTFTVVEMDGHRVEKVELVSPTPFHSPQSES